MMCDWCNGKGFVENRIFDPESGRTVTFVDKCPACKGTKVKKRKPRKDK